VLGVRPQLQHDGAQDPSGAGAGAVTIAVDRGQDLAYPIVAERAERLAVVGGVGEKPARLVGRHPQIADLGQLAGPGAAHDHRGRCRAGRGGSRDRLRRRSGGTRCL